MAPASDRLALRLGAIFGFFAVILGAMAAHGKIRRIIFTGRMGGNGRDFRRLHNCLCLSLRLLARNNRTHLVDTGTQLA